MRAIGGMEEAYRGFPLRSEFVAVDRRVQREGTVVQLSFSSASLHFMLKLFVSEMEGEGGIYLAPLGTALGYCDEGGWLSPWVLRKRLARTDGYDDAPLIRLRAMNPLSANCYVQLQAELEWLAANWEMVSAYFASDTQLPSP